MHARTFEIVRLAGPPGQAKGQQTALRRQGVVDQHLQRHVVQEAVVLLVIRQVGLDGLDFGNEQRPLLAVRLDGRL